MFLYKKQKEKLMQAKNKRFLFFLYQTQLKSNRHMDQSKMLLGTHSVIWTKTNDYLHVYIYFKNALIKLILFYKSYWAL